MVAAVLVPAVARAQLYGFPSAVGVLDDGFGVLPPAGAPFPFLPPAGAPLPPPPFPAATGAAPPCPLIVKVGRGLRHPAHTRVVSGRAGCS